MNKHMIILFALIAVGVAAVIFVSNASAEVICSGSIQPISTGRWINAQPTNNVRCYSYYVTGNGDLSVSLKSDQGRFHVYLAQGRNATRLNTRLNRAVVAPQRATKTGIIRSLPAGDYVIAVQPAGGANGYSLRIDPVKINLAKATYDSECGASNPCRFGFTNKGSIFLGAEANSTAVLPVQISCPGDILVEAEWTPGPAEMMIQICGPGRDAPCRPAASGGSVLRSRTFVSRDDNARASDWYIEVTNRSGGANNLALRYDVPAPYCVPSGQEQLRKLTIEQGVNRAGEDYANLPAGDAWDCRNKCAEDNRCAAFTFSYGDNTCWLKSAVPPTSPCDHCTSGVVAVRVFSLINQTDYYGMDFPNAPLAANSAEQCRQACIADLHCMAFTYGASTRQCWLKWGISSPSRCDDCTSGTAIYRQASVEPRTDRNGGDYDHRLLMERKPEMCRLACAQDPRCKAYTYSANDGVCHMKDSVPPTSRCDQCTSGVVQSRTFSFEWDSDRRQSDYYNFENPLNDPEICRLACAQDQRCVTYVYKRPEAYNGQVSVCYLKATTPGRVDDGCCISGVAGR